MFACTTLVAISIALSNQRLDPGIHAALYWIIIFFSAMSALFGVFSREEDTGTAPTLRVFTRPSVVFAGKLLYNILLLIFLTIIITPLYMILMNVGDADWLTMAVIALLGVVGLAGATTIIGAIVAQAPVRGALFAVLSFPVLLPLLLLAISATGAALDGRGWVAAAGDLRLIVAYVVIMITASSVLFDFVWNG
jgi:heme exporter protein B